MNNLSFKNLNKVILIFLCIILFISFSCNSKKQNEIEISKNSLMGNLNHNDLSDILISKSKAVYLSYDALNPDFGKIILIDLITKESVELFDNKYYNSNPIFFDNKGKILFASAQIGYPSELRVVKHHAWRQLYLMDFDSLFFQPYFISDDASDDFEIIKFNGLCRDFSRKQVYFINDDNKMYAFEDYKFSPKPIYTFDEDLIIWDLKLSPDNKYIAIWYSHLNSFNSGIYIYDIFSEKIIDDIKNSKNIIRLLGWSLDSNIFYQEDSLRLITLNSKAIKIIDIGLDQNEYFIKEIYPENDDSIILLIDKLVYNPKAQYRVTNSTEIARYNFKSRNFEWLTNDGNIKDELNVYAKYD